MAIGSPLGLAGSVTAGIVSALHRTITVGGSTPDHLYDGLPGEPARSTITNMIQTDSGRVVGITTAIASTGGGYIGQQSGSIGVGFAVPSETASRIAAQLIGG